MNAIDLVFSLTRVVIVAPNETKLSHGSGERKPAGRGGWLLPSAH
jgi:hypothetical protein